MKNYLTADELNHHFRFVRSLCGIRAQLSNHNKGPGTEDGTPRNHIEIENIG